MIETKVLILDKATMNDVESMHQNIYSDARINRYMFWQLSNSIEDTIDRMERTIRYQKEHPYCFTIYLKETHQAIGFMNMHISGKNQMSEGGIAIGYSYQHKGYGKQVLDAMVNLAFTKADCDTFIYQCQKENIISRKLALSCGFVYDRSEEKIIEKQHYIIDTYFKHR